MNRPLVALLSGLALPLATLAAAPRPVSFEKLTLTSEYWCDGVNAADLNGDGKRDVVAGPFWYAGPDFKTRHTFSEPVAQELEKTPTNSMFTFIADFNGDGRPDILVLGRVLFHQAFWYENPGAAAATQPDARWKKHFVANRVFGESPLFVDVDGDGKPELVSISGNVAADKIKQWGWYAPNWAAPDAPWKFVPVTEKAEFNHYYHGEGVGDLNGDVRGGDVVVLGGQRELGAAHRTVGHAEAVEGLRRRDLVHQVEVDVQQVRVARLAVHDMAVPHLLGEGPRSGLGHTGSCFLESVAAVWGNPK